MSDLNDARRNLYERCRSTGMSQREAAHRAEQSIRRTATKIDSGANPDPKASTTTTGRKPQE